MASYNVQQNPYYTPPQGRNWIADRIIAAMQSFSAPKGPEMLPAGVSGPNPTNALPRKPAGFFSALGGNDNNRINQAALLRQADVDAGRAPFEAEVGVEKELQGNEFGFRQGVENDRLKQQRALDEENRKAALERAQLGFTTARQINDDRMNASLHEKQLTAAQQIAADQRRLQNQIAVKRTPEAMSDAQAAARKDWGIGPGNSLINRQLGTIKRFAPLDPNAPSITETLPRPFSQDELNYLENDEPTPDASGQATEQMLNIEDLLNPSGIPRDITY